MREAMFIKKNAEKWKQYQNEPSSNPDEASERFITLMDDLAYAKTFYPRSKATKWINGLAGSAYQTIYKNKKEKYSRLFTFWKYELPMIVRRHHRTFLFTAIVFITFICVGYLSAARNPEFVKGMFGSDYISMTEENIANGDPFGVYKSQTQFNMFMQIALNNIGVSFRVFVGGFTMGIFTFYQLWIEGLRLGSIEQMFFANGVGIRSILIIFIHGTIEISAIIIASAAGFIMANGVLFPGTYRRIDSFKKNIKDAAKVLISLIPFFIVAAFLESYITRLMSGQFEPANKGLPAWLSIVILSLSFMLIVWYFVIWPILLEKRGFLLKKDGIVERLQNPDA